MHFMAQHGQKLAKHGQSWPRVNFEGFWGSNMGEAASKKSGKRKMRVAVLSGLNSGVTENVDTRRKPAHYAPSTEITSDKFPLHNPPLLRLSKDPGEGAVEPSFICRYVSRVVPTVPSPVKRGRVREGAFILCNCAQANQGVVEATQIVFQPNALCAAYSAA